MHIYDYLWQKIALTKETNTYETIIETTLLDKCGYVWKETPALETKLSCDLELTSEYIEVHTSKGYFSLK